MNRLALFLTVVACNCYWASTAGGERLKLTVLDSATGKPVPCRIHLQDQRGRPQRAGALPFWRDHFVCPGQVTLKLTPGKYTFDIDRGGEYAPLSGHFLIQRNSDDKKTVELKRMVHMAKEGWYAGDLHVHRDVKDIELLMQAEDLHVAPVITWWNKRNAWRDKPLPNNPLVKFDGGRFYRLLAGEDERGGGALMFFNLARPLPIAAAEREYPSSMVYLMQAKAAGGWVDVEKPFWWDVPLWLSSGQVDSIGLANNHMQRAKMYPGEAWGKPRDKSMFPDPLGNGRWTQHIYYHVLNAGLRIPPSAGSASGVLQNPVGYNRMYVHVDGPLTYEKWWRNFRAGRVVVTNGPLLRPRVNGRLPGHVFQAEAGRELELEIALNLTTRDKLSYLEVVKNGQAAHAVRLSDWANNKGKLPKVKFTKSGWFLVRAITDAPNTFRFASTGPYYVHIGDKRRISKTSAQFFLNWTKERMAQLEKQLSDPRQRGEVLKHHQTARRFWRQRVKVANAD